MLELKQISKCFNLSENQPKVLFDKLSVTFEPGEFVVIIGGNGSGKTSLLNLICGSLKADSGQIVLAGQDLTQLPEHRHYEKIGRVFQNPGAGVAANLSLLENLALAENKNKPFGLRPATSQAQRQSLYQRLKQFGLGLEDKLDERVGSFSGGERQAVALLMASVAPIDYLILDEHTAALDPSAAENIMTLTQQIIDLDKLGAIMVTHDLEQARKYGQRLIMLRQGKIVVDTRNPQEKADLLNDRDFLARHYGR